MTHESSADKMAYMMWGMVLGASAGVLVGKLTASKPGEQLMEEWRAKGRGVRHDMEQKVQDGEDVVGDKIDQVANKTKEAATAAKARVSNRARRAIDKANAEVDVQEAGEQFPGL